NIKLSSTHVHAAEDFADEGDEAGAAMANARTKFLTQVVKKNMIENIVPIIIELKNLLEKQRSPLLKDLMLCLKEIMKDYRAEVQDVLSADRQLANEIEFDLRKFEEEQKELEKQQKRTTNASPFDAASSRGNSTSGRQSLPAVGSPMKTGDFVTPELRTPGGSAITTPDDGVPANIPSTPKSAVRRQSLITTALMNSARKAIESAQKASVARSRLASAGTPQKASGTPEKASSDGGGTPRMRSESAADCTPWNKQNGETASKEGGKVDAMKPVGTRRVARAASTPEGDVTHMSRISFISTPLSPIVNLVPVAIPKNTRDAKNKAQKDKTEILCLPSPTQP
ncbi:Hypothetical predicted protein, partial [Paramuricea clavata]